MFRRVGGSFGMGNGEGEEEEGEGGEWEGGGEAFEGWRNLQLGLSHFSPFQHGGFLPL